MPKNRKVKKPRAPLAEVLEKIPVRSTKKAIRSSTARMREEMKGDEDGT